MSGRLADTEHALGLRGDTSCQRRLAAQTHQAHEVVRGGHQIACEVDTLQAAVPRSAETAHRFYPTEDFFDSLAHFLTGVVPRRVGRASVNRAATATRVLGDVRRDALNPQAPDTFVCVIALVSSECGRMKPAPSSIVNQLRQHVSLSRTSCSGNQKVHQQSISIFHERLTHVAEPSFLARTFAIQSGIGIGPTLVSCVRTLLTMEVDPTIIRTASVGTLRGRWFIFWSKALEAGSRFDQRAVDAEMLVAQQVQAIRLQHHRIEELAADAVAQQPRAVLGKRA